MSKINRKSHLHASPPLKDGKCYYLHQTDSTHNQFILYSTVGNISTGYKTPDIFIRTNYLFPAQPFYIGHRSAKTGGVYKQLSAYALPSNPP